MESSMFSKHRQVKASSGLEVTSVPSVPLRANQFVKRIIAAPVFALVCFSALGAHAEAGPSAHTYWQQETLRAEGKVQAAARFHSESNRDFMAYRAPEQVTIGR
jgi:hypothetical protein